MTPTPSRQPPPRGPRVALMLDEPDGDPRAAALVLAAVVGPVVALLTLLDGGSPLP